jgi:hypothetical protein
MLDPLEEEFHLPPLFVEKGDALWREKSLEDSYCHDLIGYLNKFVIYILGTIDLFLLKYLIFTRRYARTIVVELIKPN